ncbi:MAG: hypothetical protein QM758_07180 [Armatimonas sp.]
MRGFSLTLLAGLCLTSALLADDFQTSAEAEAAAKSAGSRIAAADSCQADARKDNDRNNAEWSKANQELAEAIDQKQKGLEELRQGYYCSKCNRPASEIEKTGESFSQHLGRVKGTPVPAPPDVIRKKAEEYNAKIEQAQKSVDSHKQQWTQLNARYQKCGGERNQAVYEQQVAQSQVAVLKAQEAQQALREKVRKEQEARLKLLQEEQQRLAELRKEQEARQKALHEEAEQQKQERERQRAERDAHIKQLQDDLDKWHKEMLQHLEQLERNRNAPPTSTPTPPVEELSLTDRLHSATDGLFVGSTEPNPFEETKTQPVDTSRWPPVLQQIWDEVQQGWNNLRETLKEYTSWEEFKRKNSPYISGTSIEYPDKSLDWKQTLVKWISPLPYQAPPNAPSHDEYIIPSIEELAQPIDPNLPWYRQFPEQWKRIKSGFSTKSTMENKVRKTVTEEGPKK